MFYARQWNAVRAMPDGGPDPLVNRLGKVGGETGWACPGPAHHTAGTQGNWTDCRGKGWTGQGQGVGQRQGQREGRPGQSVERRGNAAAPGILVLPGRQSSPGPILLSLSSHGGATGRLAGGGGGGGGEGGAGAGR